MKQRYRLNQGGKQKWPGKQKGRQIKIAGETKIAAGGCESPNRKIKPH